MKIAFLDRDGTIIKDYEDEMWCSIEEPEFLYGAIDALQEIKKKGFEIIIITNQYLINEGIITLRQYESITQKFLKILGENGVKVLDIFYCPHSRTGNCDCIKPKPGLINQALERYPEINLSESFLAGDSLTDIELAQAFGLKSFSINLKADAENNIYVESLKEVVKYI